MVRNSQYQTARNVALRRDRVCQSCGDEEDLHAHHIVPRSEGGPDTPENLVILCKYCHPKYEGTNVRPKWGGDGVTVGDIARKWTAQHLNRIVVHVCETFKNQIQRDPSICNSCFRRLENGHADRKHIWQVILERIVTDTFFHDEIQKDPDICSNCFRRIRGRYERNYRVDTLKGELITHPVDGYGDDVYRNPRGTVKISEKGGHRGLKTVCKCGFRYHSKEEWKNRPLDKKTFFEYTDRLLDRLDEKGVTYEESKLRNILDEMKSNPEEQFADDRIYAKAIEHVINIQTAKA